MHNLHNPAAAAVVTEDATPARSVSEDGRSARKPCGEVANSVVESSPQLILTSEGTQPCNTVPANSNSDGFKPLLYGIDSLYLSYPGDLSEEWDIRLDELKQKAQSEIEAESALAQVKIGEHLFEVLDRGAPRFAYIMVDNCFYIKISRPKAKSMPLAHVQISSEYLAAVGVEAAEKSLRVVVNTLGIVKDDPRVSRADLFLDFTCDADLDGINQKQWVTRAHKLAKYYDRRLANPFTGWVVGIGGDLSSRLYEKLFEIEVQSHKFYLLELWKTVSRSEDERVWRQEFQCRREPLKQLGINTLSDLLKHQAALWQYLTQDWLRLTIPNPKDKTRSRWPNHPLWDAISGVYFRNLEQPKLKRFRPQRLPADERLFVHGLGGFTSLMARDGIEDFGEGLGEYLAQADAYHKLKGSSLKSYVARKVKTKNRKFNTVDNGEYHPATKRERKKQAEAYRAAKEGEEE